MATKIGFSYTAKTSLQLYLSLPGPVIAVYVDMPGLGNYILANYQTQREGGKDPLACSQGETISDLECSLVDRTLGLEESVDVPVASIITKLEGTQVAVCRGLCVHMTVSQIVQNVEKTEKLPFIVAK